MSVQEKLRQLFLLDSQLRGMRSRLDNAISRHKRQQSKLDQLERQRSELGEQVKQNQAKASTLEKQASDVDTRVTTLRNQMNSVKNNKEYSALLIEVNTLKIDKTKVEEQALEQMGKVDQLKAEFGELEGKIAEQAKLVTGADGEVKTCRAELGEQLTELTTRRDAAEQEVPADARTQFRKLVEIHDGDAMAVVSEESRRNMEYTCSGCYMLLPVERVNAIMRRPDDVVCCPSCGRILYMEAELRTSFAPTK